MVSDKSETGNITTLFPHNDGVKIKMSVEDAKAALAGLEGKLQDAMARRDKILVEISRASAEAAAAHRIDPKLAPLNKRAVAIDGEIAVIRMEISHARRALKLQEDSAAGVKDKQAAANGGNSPHLVQLEIRAPDGRVIKQSHRSIDSARAALSPGYEVVGQVIGSGVVSPIGPGARSFMEALLDAHGDVLMEWLEARGVVGNPVKITLPSNGKTCNEPF
jgi:hypothetical protein